MTSLSINFEKLNLNDQTFISYEPINNDPTINADITLTRIPAGPLKLIVLGDGSYLSQGTTISNRLTALGYTTATVTSRQLSTTYTGSELNIATFNTVLMITNASQTGAAALSTNLKNFVNAGGHFVSSTFLWNLYPSGFDATITPFTLTPQSSDSTGNMTVQVTHPITTGINTSITGGASILNNGNVGLQSGATQIAKYTSSGVPYVATLLRGDARLVGINAYCGLVSSYANLCNLVVNACLWANGNIY